MQLRRVSTVVLTLGLVFASTALSATFTVTNTSDSGVGSLRQAITDANANPNASTPDVIQFNIAGGGVKTIAPATNLPAINESVTIDGYTQPGSTSNSNGISDAANGTLLIQLSGHARTFELASEGLRVSAAATNVTIRGLIINRWNTGIFLAGGGGHRVIGNYIGTDPTGSTAPLQPPPGNARQSRGVVVANAFSCRIGDGTPESRNVISGNGTVNIFITGASATNNLVRGNFIGTNAGGTAAVFSSPIVGGVALQDGAHGNQIGGDASGHRNVISGNGARGIALFIGTTGTLTNNIIAGNYIGTDASGTKAIPNGDGIVLQGQANIIGGVTAPRAPNVISGNTGNGIQLSSSAPVKTSANVIQANMIGCDVTGARPLPNGRAGISIIAGASDNLIGSFGSPGGNVIAFNRQVAIQINSGSPPTVGNAILRNSIFRNDGIGIDLNSSENPAGTISPNDAGDADAGANNAQNFPVLTAATATGGRLRITGTLNSLPDQSFRIEFFSDTAADPSGHGEGRTYLGTVDVMTDASGDAPFTVDLPFVMDSAVVTATATSTSNDTSEFSPAVPIDGAPGRLLNLSTRLRVLTGDEVLIGGFILSGLEPKRVIVRGLGPSLSESAVSGVLPNPALELYDGDGTLIAANENWKDTQQAQIEATGVQPTNDLESAIVDVLTPGNYTAVVRDFAGATGVGLVEVYDLEQAALSKLANVSTRGFVDTGDDVMIGGIIVGGAASGDARVVVRAIGPSLGEQGITNPLADPTLELVNGSGVTIATNDNWRETQEAQLQATGLQPTNDAEAAVVAAVAPGNYTAIVRGKNDTTGIALVEVYNVP